MIKSSKKLFFIPIATDHKDGKLLKYDTHGSITIHSTADDDDMTYTCEAHHQAIRPDKPMRATTTLSVFCKYIIL